MSRPSTGSGLADLFAILAGILYTFYLIAIDRARQTLKPLPVLALATVAAAGPLILFSNLLGEKVLPSQPVVTAMVGWFAYNERLSLTDARGALLICTAMVLIRLPQRQDRVRVAAPEGHRTN